MGRCIQSNASVGLFSLAQECCSPVALRLYVLPAQNINILTLGSPTGTGVFFPNGLNGVIKTPAGFNLQDPGTASFYKAVPSGQVCRD